MTDEQFAAGVDAILETGVKGHAAHRELDMLWTRYTQELPLGHPLQTATAKWMRVIEGDHSDASPYPLAQGTEARRAETLGSVHDGPMATPCAQSRPA